MRRPRVTLVNYLDYVRRRYESLPPPECAPIDAPLVDDFRLGETGDGPFASHD